MAFCDRLKKSRTKKGFSQQELASKLNITDGTVSNYEKGVAFPRWDKIKLLCEVLDVDPNYLFWDDLSVSLKSKIIESKVTTRDDSLLSGLNERGKQKVKEYINDLTDNEKYTREEFFDKESSGA